MRLRELLIGAGATFMGQSIQITAAAASNWVSIAPSATGFASDPEAAA